MAKTKYRPVIKKHMVKNPIKMSERECNDIASGECTAAWMRVHATCVRLGMMHWAEAATNYYEINGITNVVRYIEYLAEKAKIGTVPKKQRRAK